MATPCVVCEKPKRYRNHEGKCTDCVLDSWLKKPSDIPTREEPKAVISNKPGKKTV